MKMKIIGHKGAASLAFENTLKSFQAAIDAGVDAVELDIRLTKDRQLVVIHDADLSRVSADKREVKDLTLDEIQSVNLNSGDHIPSLSEVMELIGDFPVVIDIKDIGSARLLINVLENFPNAQVSVASFKYHELSLIKALRPKMPAYVGSLTNPFDIVFIARAIEADGLNINFWLLNPFNYIMARRSSLNIVVYTVNNFFLGYFIHLLYPKAAICTNKPQLFIKQKKEFRESKT